MSEYIIRMDGVHQQYPAPNKGEAHVVLNDINLKIKRGELVTLVGPTGCGKSTLLRLILGSELPFAGQALINGSPILQPDRDRGIVFQRYSLFENRTVLHNVMLGLELEEFGLFESIFLTPGYRARRREFREKAEHYLSRVGLLQHADKYPHQLSGGMRQRAAIAQAMVMKPAVLLMDEPFGALDAGTREEMQLFVIEEWERTGQTIIFVTHDLEEAVFLGTRVIVLSQHYSNGDESETKGAKIVKDVEIPWPHTSTDAKYTPEFTALLEEIRHEGLDPGFRQHINDFDLSHRDAFWPASREDWERRSRQ
jgi:NitT/TauT family transport system ATP-binding protein